MSFIRVFAVLAASQPDGGFFYIREGISDSGPNFLGKKVFSRRGSGPDLQIGKS